MDKKGKQFLSVNHDQILYSLILELTKESNNSVELAKIIARDQSSIHRRLIRLKEEGYIEYDLDSIKKNAFKPNYNKLFEEFIDFCQNKINNYTKNNKNEKYIYNLLKTAFYKNLNKNKYLLEFLKTSFVISTDNKTMNELFEMNYIVIEKFEPFFPEHHFNKNSVCIAMSTKLDLEFNQFITFIEDIQKHIIPYESETKIIRENIWNLFGNDNPNILDIVNKWNGSVYDEKKRKELLKELKNKYNIEKL